MKVNIDDLTLNATELGKVLGGLSARRVRQLAEEEVFVRAERGRFPLIPNVAAYVAQIENRTDPEDLRTERIALIRAQTRRIELDNRLKEGGEGSLDWQSAVISALSLHWLLRLRPVAGWLYTDLADLLPTSDARRVAGTVQNWLVGLRSEIERETKRAAVRLRGNRELATDHKALVHALSGGRDEDVEHNEVA